jgi:hypothetical protein
MAKCLWKKYRGKEDQYSPEGLSRTHLCALCLLFIHLLVFNPGGSRGKEESLSIKGLVFFCLYRGKALRSLRALRLIFSLSPEAAETFIISRGTR